MSIAIEQNRNDGNLHIVEVTNVSEMQLKGTRVEVIQGSGKRFYIKCNSDFAAQFALEKLNSNFYLDYHETFLPLSNREEIPEIYLNPRVIVGRLQSAGLYNIQTMIQKQPDLLEGLTYYELGNLLKGRIPANFDYGKASKSLFIPYVLFKAGITPSTYWEQLRINTIPTSETYGTEAAYLTHEAGFCPRFENGIRVRD